MTEPSIDPSNGTVLVVDDTLDNLILTVRSLQKAGIYALAASQGLECLDIVTKRHVDVILLDLIMPQLDGWGTLAALRRDQTTRNIPVIMFSCDDRLVVRERAMKEGAVDFLPRPVKPDVLLACVRMQLRSVARARALEAIDRELDSTLSRAAEAFGP